MLRTHYVTELEAVRKNLVQMGETTLALCREALQSVNEPTNAPSARASELEAQTDHQLRLIHDQCVKIITLQAPVASDARLVTGILDAILDLELIGDYAYEIVTLTSSMSRKPPTQVAGQIAEVGGKIRDVLSAAIDSWRNMDRAQALSLPPLEARIRAECEALYEKLAQLLATPGEGIAYMDLMLVCKHLQRILRHSVCVGNQAAEAAPSSQVA